MLISLTFIKVESALLIFLPNIFNGCYRKKNAKGD